MLIGCGVAIFCIEHSLSKHNSLLDNANERKKEHQEKVCTILQVEK